MTDADVLRIVLAEPTLKRAERLRDVCGDDHALFARVEALLQALPDAETNTQRTGSTADLRGDETADTLPASDGGPHESVGQHISRYKLLEQIGEGGFGTVWAAEQREPVKRRVALKIIKLGMDTKQVIARFEAERQALAMMDHPNIARVLDAGTTETGRPFFVMELVKGVPVLDYCDTEKIDTESRLKLFTQVCHAIQHAHQKGIIHRDIKPSNVLVTLHDGTPVPKVIDFGIAKATNHDLTEKTIYTQHRQMIGTPAYMSPEQAEMSGLDIDTRSDIYSLGVLLYELLTGTTPFTHEELTSAGFDGMMRLIRDAEPHRPSSRVSSLGATAESTARRRATNPQKLGLLIRGDLDWIVMKCLEKDRTRRYETATELASDIHRHLADEPVSAGPPSAGYKVRKFVKRHRGRVIATGVVAATLVLGVVGTAAGLVWALDERSRANIAADVAEQARDESERERRAAEQQTEIAEAQLARSEEFRQFMAELLGSIKPDRRYPERSQAVRELIDTAYDRLKAGTVKNAEARREVVELLADTANRHFWHDLHNKLMSFLLDEARQRYGRDHPRTRLAAAHLTLALMNESRSIEVTRVVDEYFDPAVPLDEAVDGWHPQLDLLTSSASAQINLGNYDRALDEIDRTLVIAEQIGNRRILFFNHTMRSRIMRTLGRFEEAKVASDAAKELLDAEATHTFALWVTAIWTSDRAELMLRTGQYGEAAELYVLAAEDTAALAADDFWPHVFFSKAAEALRLLGRNQEALAMAQESREGLLLKRAPEAYIRDTSRQIILALADLGQAEEFGRELDELKAPPELPLAVYRDGTAETFWPSAVMGETDKVAYDLSSVAGPYEGDFCFEWRVLPGDSWAAIGWVEPANDWGTLPGGYDLTGARRLSFSARGAVGGEQATVGIGVIREGEYADTMHERMPIRLSTDWQQFSIPLDGLDLSTVRGGFVIESRLSDEEQVMYFDSIYIE